LRAFLAAALLAAAGAGCSSSGTEGGKAASTIVTSAPLPATSGDHGVVPLPAGAPFDYQIGGAYPPDPHVRVVTRDHSDPPVAGLYNICYLNAFQTQPDEDSQWQAEHPDLLLRDRSGYSVADPNWPGEYLLDVSSAGKRSAVASLMYPLIDGCAAHGFQAIEPDNLDSWTRSLGRLTEADAVAYAQLLIARAHADSLAIGQKNTAQIAPQGPSLGFDFAVAEECQVYSECDAYLSAYGHRVLEIEYTDNGSGAFRRACAARGTVVSVILRDRDVVPRGDPAYSYHRC
jgi:endo-alpha-1,4-polygalactosaminidase (GH114 family)